MGLSLAMRARLPRRAARPGPPATLCLAGRARGGGCGGDVALGPAPAAPPLAARARPSPAVLASAARLAAALPAAGLGGRRPRLALARAGLCSLALPLTLALVSA